MIDYKARQRLLEEQRNKKLLQEVKNSTPKEDPEITSLRTAPFDEVLRRAATRGTEKDILNELKKISQAIVILYKNQPKLDLPSTLKMQGNVDVSRMPAVSIKNFNDLARYFEQMKNALQNMAYAISQAKQGEIKIPEIKIPQIKNVNTTDPKLVGMIGEINESLIQLRGMKLDMPNGMEVSVTNFPPQHIPTPVTNISINALSGSLDSQVVSVGTTATQIPPVNLSNRRGLLIFNSDTSKTLYIGGSTVAAAGTGQGLPIPPQTYAPSLQTGSNMNVYGIVASGSINVNVLELSDWAAGR